MYRSCSFDRVRPGPLRVLAVTVGQSINRLAEFAGTLEKAGAAG